MDERVNLALSFLKRSPFRAKFKLTAKDLLYIQEKGLDTIQRHAFDLITARIAPVFPKNDGKQTPMRNHPVFIAQHATATCCRTCILKWHRIAKRKALTASEINFIVDLIMNWIIRQHGMPI
jgi:hypothetical protein